MVLFSPVPPARCATKHHTLLSLSNIWVDSTTFQSLSVIRRVSFQFLRFRPIYFLDSCFSSSLNRSLFHLPRASPASGQVGAQREQRPWSAFPPLHAPGREETRSASRVPPPFPTSQASVSQCFGAERVRSMRWRGLTSQASCLGEADSFRSLFERPRGLR